MAQDFYGPWFDRIVRKFNRHFGLKGRISVDVAHPKTMDCWAYCCSGGSGAKCRSRITIAAIQPPSSRRATDYAMYRDFVIECLVHEYAHALQHREKSSDARHGHNRTWGKRYAEVYSYWEKISC